MHPDKNLQVKDSNKCTKLENNFENSIQTICNLCPQIYQFQSIVNNYMYLLLLRKELRKGTLKNILKFFLLKKINIKCSIKSLLQGMYEKSMPDIEFVESAKLFPFAKNTNKKLNIII